NHMWDAPRHLDAVARELVDLARVVREQPNRSNREARQHVRRHAVVAFVVAEAERDIRIHRVEPLDLQRVRANLVEQTDAAPPLRQIEEDPGAFFRDAMEAELELIATIAAQRSERVPGQALRMEPREHILLPQNVAMHERDVLLAVAVVVEGDDLEL